MSIDSIQPIVLVGGGSERFGRDKLLEPLPGTGETLVSVSIDALRAVFGQRVAVVGACDRRVRALADMQIEDVHPGVGPIGGIVSGLLAGSDVFVASGDLAALDAATVRELLDAATDSPHALAVWAETDRVHPCLGLYRLNALKQLESRIALGNHRLRDALQSDQIVTVSISADAARNINTPGDWDR